jgi:hypothetical protein
MRSEVANRLMKKMPEETKSFVDHYVESIVKTNQCFINEINEVIKTYKGFGFHLNEIKNENTIQFTKTKPDGVACYILTIQYNRIQIFDEGENKVLFDEQVDNFKIIRKELEKLFE